MLDSGQPAPRAQLELGAVPIKPRAFPGITAAVAPAVVAMSLRAISFRYGGFRVVEMLTVLGLVQDECGRLEVAESLGELIAVSLMGVGVRL